jgi:hypothetical protein
MKLGILTIATNRYLEYYSELVSSLFDNYSEVPEIEWYLFTDRVSDAIAIKQRHPNLKMTIIPIAGYGFPQATLYRYKIYAQHKEKLSADILMHLDADMLIRSNRFYELVSASVKKAPLCLVRHPGFYRPQGIQAVKFYASHPNFFLRDLLRIVKLGSLGDWETSKKSTAFVSRDKRNRYHCGGIWFGLNGSIKEMCDVLSSSVELDEKHGVMAKWHDESHLNKYSAQFRVNSLTPELCFDPSYPNLEDLDEIVRAVDKNA